METTEEHAELQRFTRLSNISTEMDESKPVEVCWIR